MNFSELSTGLTEEIKKCPGQMSIMLEVDNHTFEWESDRKITSASLIKLPILLEGFKQIELGKWNLSEAIQILESQKVEGAGVIQALSTAELSVHDLLTLMIIVSDNTATNILIDLFDMEQINAFIKDSGCVSTELNRKMMDFKAIEKGINNWTTSREMMLMLQEIDNGSRFSSKSRDYMKGILHNQQLLDKLPLFIDTEKGWIGNKTGELPGIEHDCAIMKVGGRTAYISVLCDDLPSKGKGKIAIANIGELVWKYMLN
ncbi:serine hydrolase [Peribacillus alkalitolerans]|uniref:serine hydrolase n=1 Tax=Peribacillus alkalitolerans TaxID=1550385 RepID=UPI0013D0D432|nr:serine hydrolase [Peribacillus alkalitolerans]